MQMYSSSGSIDGSKWASYLLSYLSSFLIPMPGEYIYFVLDYITVYILLLGKPIA